MNKKVVLLAIIYLAFISLGIPDGILGVSWPKIRMDFELPLETMGILTSILLFNSAFSSIISGKIINKFGTDKVTFFSCLLTGSALLGYALSKNLLWLIFFTFPLGLGQGAVDSGLNYYVAKKYTARHMNWLHCFWGIGATLGPLIMTQSILVKDSWRFGYVLIAILQLILVVILLFSLLKKMWTWNSDNANNDDTEINGEYGLSSSYCQFLAVIMFFLYTGIEFSMSAWISSVLIESRNIPLHLAGIASTVYYASIMVGRFISGFYVNRFGNLKMIRLGLILSIFGGLFMNFSTGYQFILIGVVMFGLGLAPLYPCLMHETPIRFKSSISNKLIGYQVGAACLGGSIVSAGLGLILSNYSLGLLFVILTILLGVYLVINEILNTKYKHIIKNASK